MKGSGAGFYFCRSGVEMSAGLGLGDTVRKRGRCSGEARGTPGGFSVPVLDMVWKLGTQPSE